jgi:hypothetical protein
MIKEGMLRIPPPPRDGKRSFFAKSPGLDIYINGKWISLEEWNRKNDMP